MTHPGATMPPPRAGGRRSCPAVTAPHSRRTWGSERARPATLRPTAAAADPTRGTASPGRAARAVQPGPPRRPAPYRPPARDGIRPAPGRPRRPSCGRRRPPGSRPAGRAADAELAVGPRTRRPGRRSARSRAGRGRPPVTGPQVVDDRPQSAALPGWPCRSTPPGRRHPRRQRASTPVTAGARALRVLVDLLGRRTTVRSMAAPPGTREAPPGAPEDKRQDQADDADDHEDVADRLDVDAADRGDDHA